MARREPSLDEWRDAIWDYLLEHSDIMDSGALFVKFHTDGRHKFESRIRSRIRGYHRSDPRAREQHIDRQREIHASEKQSKKDAYRKGQAQCRFAQLALSEMSREFLREVIRRMLMHSHGRVIELRRRRRPQAERQEAMRHTQNATTPPPTERR